MKQFVLDDSNILERVESKQRVEGAKSILVNRQCDPSNYPTTTIMMCINIFVTYLHTQGRVAVLCFPANNTKGTKYRPAYKTAGT